MTIARKRTRPTTTPRGSPLAPPFGPIRAPRSRTPLSDLFVALARDRMRKKRGVAGGLASRRVRGARSKELAILQEAYRLRARGVRDRDIAAAVAAELGVSDRYVRKVLRRGSVLAPPGFRSVPTSS
jgi:hypothetical protein